MKTQESLRSLGLPLGFFQLMQLKHICLSAYPVPWHKFTPLQIAEPPQHLFHPPRQGSAGRSHPECHCLEIQILKVYRRKKIFFCCKGLGKAGLKPYLKLNCNVCTKCRHIVKIKLLQRYFQHKSISCQIFLKNQKQNKLITLAFETVICKEFHAN